MPDVIVTSFLHESSNSFTHVAHDLASGHAAIIDPVLDYDAAAGRTCHASVDQVIEHVRENGFKLQWIIETHVHADHLSAAPHVKATLGGAIGIGAHITTVQDTFGKLFNAGPGFATDGSQFDHLFSDGERYLLGGIEARTLHTPGHTPACMSHLIGDALFVGDTLFMPDYGTARCDFPGGDAHTLYRSIRRLFELPDETRVFLCHDYLPDGRDTLRCCTTIGEERRGNIHARDGISEDEFVRMREARDQTLAMPTLILPSVQVNMRAGHLPPADTNGIHYLRIPLDQL